MKSLITKMVLGLAVVLGMAFSVDAQDLSGRVEAGKLAQFFPGPGVVPGSPNVTAVKEADRLHLILIGYTDEDECGKACLKDVNAVRSTFEQAFAGKNKELKVHYWIGLEWTPARILESLRGLNIGPRDAVLFYHSGHGKMRYVAGANPAQFLLTSRGWLDRGEVRQILLDKRPFGLVMLTDCCSSWEPGFAPRGLVIRDRGLSIANWETIRGLFLQSAKVIDITAAEKGKTATFRHHIPSRHGAESAFTVALLELLHDPARTFTTWTAFFPQLSQMTERASTDGHGGQHRPFKFQLSEHQGQPANPGVVPQPSAPVNPFTSQGRSGREIPLGMSP